MSTCVNGHPIRGPRDRLPSGHCRECDRHYQANYRRKRRSAMALLRRIEESGVAISELNDDSAFTLGLNWALGSDEVRQGIEQSHPELVAKLRRSAS